MPIYYFTKGIMLLIKQKLGKYDSMTTATKQVKSKTRVTEHGEVFTAEREVNAMLDLVKHETERIESRFLEPACGTGNFLVEVLRRKLSVVKSLYHKNQIDYERNALLAVMTLYGIDLLEDNIQESIYRLLGLIEKDYKSIFKSKTRKAYLSSVAYVLKHNIVCGDALTFQKSDGSGEPIVFAEWSFVDALHVKRRDYRFDHLLREAEFGANAGLFSDLGEEAFIPKAIKEDYPLTHYLKLGEQDA